MLRFIIGCCFTFFWAQMEGTLQGRDIVSIDDLSKDEIEQVLELAHYLEKHPQPTLLKGKILATCFFEPSTRTRLSFESAMYRLGGSVIGFSDAENSSVKKGETLADTAHAIDGFADLLVIRHPQEGSAQVAANACSIPVINGGDGANQHPTQTLVDLYTIQQCQGRLDNVHIALVGDLRHSRTIHSLVSALAHYQPQFYLVAEEALQLPDAIIKGLEQKGIHLSQHRQLDDIMGQVDIVYMTRMQKERFQEGVVPKTPAVVLEKSMLAQAKPTMRILHPLPRNEEIPVAIDETTHAYYFQQMANGPVVRMALLALILSEARAVSISSVTQREKEKLVQEAAWARTHSYSPYSGFSVGAAILGRDGSIYRGTNVENSSFGLTCCAERVALFKAVSEGVTDFKAIAVVVPGGGTPCGACRQVLSEFNREMLVLYGNEEGVFLEETSMAALLPDTFTIDKKAPLFLD